MIATLNYTQKNNTVVTYNLQLENDYKSDCVSDLAKLDAFLNNNSADQIVALIKKEIPKASFQDVQDAIFGESYGRKGIKTSLTQSAIGENKDGIQHPSLQRLNPQIKGLYVDTANSELVVNGKVISVWGNVYTEFTPKSITTRIKDLIKLRLGLECGKWVRLAVNGQITIKDGQNNEIFYQDDNLDSLYDGENDVE